VASEGSLYVPPGSRAKRFAEALAWLWRLGPILETPHAGAVGVGWLEDTVELSAMLDERRLAGAVVFAPRPGPDVGPVRPRHRVRGVAKFGPGERVAGQFSLFDGGTAVTSSSLGNHAIREGDLLAIGADPETAWGTLESYWVFPTVLAHLAELLERPLVLLPPVGWIRHDDLPGDAHIQLVGAAKPDRKVRAHVQRMTRAFRAAGAKVNLAVSARGLVDGEEAPLDEIWPAATSAIADGVAEGVIEPVCHGYLHVDTARLERGEVEPREYRELDGAEVGRRIDLTVAWQRQALGAGPETFVAPNWSYGPGVLEAASARGMGAWLPPLPGPLAARGGAHESLLSTLEGLHALDYLPLARLAAAGVPPMIVIHGGLFDGRVKTLSLPRDSATLARLAVRRDLVRIPSLQGVRWIGAGRMLRAIQAHGQGEWEGSTAHWDGSGAALVDAQGRTALGELPD
jgi:hypothetical protein